MEKRLRYAMIGGADGSFIGPIHRMALRLDDLADLVAGCFSRHDAANKATASALRLDEGRVYESGDALIEGEKGKVDFIVICTTNESHYPLAKKALLAGFDVFCEKPIAWTAEEALDLEACARRRRRILGVPFTYLGYPMVRLARDLVARGKLGKIDKIVLEYQKGSFRKAKSLSGWKVDPKIAGPGCVISDLGVHGFTLIEYVTQLKVRTLLADLSSFSSPHHLDDDASVLMRLDAGAKAVFVTSKIATGEENGVRLRVYGDKASLHWDQEEPNRLVVRSPFAPDEVYHRKAPYIGEVSPLSVQASRFPSGHHEGFVEALATLYDDFARAVLTRKALPDGAFGSRSIRFVEAALKSSKSASAWTRL